MDSLDLNRDGWIDLLVTNHQKRFDHSAAGTNLFWGGPDGISLQAVHNIPTIGVHLDAMVDAGHVYHRKYEWDYVSAPIQIPVGSRCNRLHWKAITALNTRIKFQIRGGADRETMLEAGWEGRSGADSFYLDPGSQLKVGREHRWLQYRALLTSPDGGNPPVLTEVALECRR